MIYSLSSINQLYSVNYLLVNLLDQHFYFQSWTNLNRQAQTFLSSHQSPESHEDGDRIKSGTMTGLCLGDEPSNVRHARARLLNLVGRIGTATKEPWKADMCIELLWRIVFGSSSYNLGTHSSDASSPSETASHKSNSSVATSSMSSMPANYRHPEPIEAVLAQQLVILREFRCSGVDQRLRAMHWLTKAVEHVSQASLQDLYIVQTRSAYFFQLSVFVSKMIQVFSIQSPLTISTPSLVFGNHHLIPDTPSPNSHLNLTGQHIFGSSILTLEVLFIQTNWIDFATRKWSAVQIAGLSVIFVVVGNSPWSRSLPYLTCWDLMLFCASSRFKIMTTGSCLLCSGPQRLWDIPFHCTHSPNM